MNCQEALSLLYEIIDKEASEIDAKEVQQHLDRCKHCFEVYRLESAIQDFINEKLKDGNPSASLETLRAKVVRKLDEIDREGGVNGIRPFFKRTAALLVAAASLVILIGGVFLGRGYYHHQTVFKPLERAHLAVAEVPAGLENAAAAFSAIRRVRDELGYAIYPSVAGFSLVGGDTEEIMGVEMTHLVYSHDNEVVSVFIVPSDEYEIPNDLKNSRVVEGQISFFNHRCSRCRLVYHKMASVIVVTATTEDEVDLFNFVPGYAVI